MSSKCSTIRGCSTNIGGSCPSSTSKSNLTCKTPSLDFNKCSGSSSSSSSGFQDIKLSPVNLSVADKKVGSSGKGGTYSFSLFAFPSKENSSGLNNENISSLSKSKRRQLCTLRNTWNKYITNKTQNTDSNKNTYKLRDIQSSSGGVAYAVFDNISNLKPKTYYSSSNYKKDKNKTLGDQSKCKAAIHTRNKKISDYKNLVSKLNGYEDELKKVKQAGKTSGKSLKIGSLEGKIKKKKKSLSSVRSDVVSSQHNVLNKCFGKADKNNTLSARGWQIASVVSRPDTESKLKSLSKNNYKNESLCRARHYAAYNQCRGWMKLALNNLNLNSINKYCLNSYKNTGTQSNPDYQKDEHTLENILFTGQTSYHKKTKSSSGSFSSSYKKVSLKNSSDLDDLIPPLKNGLDNSLLKPCKNVRESILQNLRAYMDMVKNPAISGNTESTTNPVPKDYFNRCKGLSGDKSALCKKMKSSSSSKTSSGSSQSSQSSKTKKATAIIDVYNGVQLCNGGGGQSCAVAGACNRASRNGVIKLGTKYTSKSDYGDSSYLKNKCGGAKEITYGSGDNKKTTTMKIPAWSRTNGCCIPTFRELNDKCIPAIGKKVKHGKCASS